MTHSQVLYDLQALKQTYKTQGFRFTRDQRARYDELLKNRRQRVLDLYADDRVSFGSAPIKKED